MPSQIFRKKLVRLWAPFHIASIKYLNWRIYCHLQSYWSTENFLRVKIKKPKGNLHHFHNYFFKGNFVEDLLFCSAAREQNDRLPLFACHPSGLSILRWWRGNPCGCRPFWGWSTNRERGWKILRVKQEVGKLRLHALPTLPGYCCRSGCNARHSR